MSNSNSWNLENISLSEDKINKNIKEISKQINQDVNFLLNLIKKYDPLELLKFMAFHTDEVLENSKNNKNTHNDEVAYSQLKFILKYVASNPNGFGTSKNLTDFSWKKFNRTYSNYENHLIKYTDNLILKANIDPSVRTQMQSKFYSYMFPNSLTKFENIPNKKRLLKLQLQPYIDKINATFTGGLDVLLDSIESIAKIGINGISDLNKDCELFAKRSQSKLDKKKQSGINKTNKELIEQIIVEEGWQTWINSLQSKSESLDLFDVEHLVDISKTDLDLLSVESASQYSNNFGWLTESSGIDDSLFIKVNNSYYCFDGMFIYDKAFNAIKKAVIKKFPNYENTWNSIEKEKSGLLPVSIFAGIFGHFTYTLNFEIENSYFTALFEKDDKKIYVQVPSQHGYNIPLNPIKEIEITEYALKSYNLSLKNFDIINSPIVIVDSIDEFTDKLIVDKNKYYISYSYLSSIVNDWNELRLLRDNLLGTSVDNIEVEEDEVEEIDSKVLDIDDTVTDEADTDEADTDEADTDEADTDEADTDATDIDDTDIDDTDTDDTDTDDTDTDDTDTDDTDTDDTDIDATDTDDTDIDEEIEYLEDIFDEEIDKTIETIDEVEPYDSYTEVDENNIDDVFKKDSDFPGYSDYQLSCLPETELIPSEPERTKVSKSFSFFDVLNNVAKGKDPLSDQQELEDEKEDNIEVTDLDKDFNTDLDNSNKEESTISNTTESNEKQMEATPVKSNDEINNENNKNEIVNNKVESTSPKSTGFSFFDVLNNVASGKNPLTAEKIVPENIANDLKKDAVLNTEKESTDLSNIEHFLDDDDEEELFFDDESIVEELDDEELDDELREVFDDDSIEGRDIVTEDTFSEGDFDTIVEPEDEYEELKEIPIDDIIEEYNSTLDSSIIEESNPIEDDKSLVDNPISTVETASMINSVNEILDEIDESDLDDYGTSEIEEDEDDDDIFEQQNEDEDIDDEVQSEIIDEIESYNKSLDTDNSSTKLKDIDEEVEEVAASTNKLKAIEENRIMEEDIPTIENLWPSSILDIVSMSEKLDDSPFFNICKSNDVELLNAIDYLIGQALESQKVDGKDKMFTIPESNLSIVLPNNQNDQLKKWERMNSLGALMYSKDMDVWNALTLSYGDNKKLLSIREWSLSKDSYSAVDWKFVVTTGTRLKKKK